MMRPAVMTLAAVSLFAANGGLIYLTKNGRYTPPTLSEAGQVRSMTNSQVANWREGGATGVDTVAKAEHTGVEESTKVTVSDARAACESNPYKGALKESLHEIGGRMDAWLDNIGDHHNKALREDKYHQKDHERYFPFNADIAHCKNESMSCMGGPCTSDQSKNVCGLEELKKMQHDDEDCVVYSIGGNNQWSFEIDILKNTPCQVHTFDCTGPLDRFKPPEHDRLHFHHVCLDTQHQEAKKVCRGNYNICGEMWTLSEMQQKLNHRRIDLYKMDIEGFEWQLFESWPELGDAAASKVVLPYQILVEIHFQTAFAELRPYSGRIFRTPRDIVNLQAHFLRMGYVVTVRDDNPFCKSCTELTLIRTRCPAY